MPERMKVYLLKAWMEEVSENPDPPWSRQVSKVLDGLNTKASLTLLFVFERLR
jgi:hypothetical protein